MRTDLSSTELIMMTGISCSASFAYRARSVAGPSMMGIMTFKKHEMRSLLQRYGQPNFPVRRQNCSTWSTFRRK